MSLIYQGLHLNLSGFESTSLSFLVGSAGFLISRPLIGSAVKKASLSTTSSTVIELEQTQIATNQIFIWLQILSAAFVAFAHGANDVANAIGPVAAILHTLKHETLTIGMQTPAWLLFLGASGIVIGLAMWGWRVIQTVGEKITELDPIKGFCAEFGAAITILLASKIGVPISTTHALIGAIFAVGLHSSKKALNFKQVEQIVISWIVTLPLCAFFSIVAFFLLKYCLKLNGYF